MNTTNTLALVVDDEPLVRNLTVRALTREGFECDQAQDGHEGARMVAKNDYTVVVTDLKMPNQNGHAFAVELMSSPHPPAVVILTGVTEPRLAKDLLSRGIEDIVYKPIDYAVFGMKVRAIADRALAKSASSNSATGAEADEMAENSISQANPGPLVAESGRGPTSHDATITLGSVAERIKSGDGIIAIGEATLQVYRMTDSDELDANALSNSIATSAVLSDEIIKLAQSPFYNPAGAKVPDLSRAVVQIGRKRVGHLALAATAQAALSIGDPSPLNVRLIWAKGVAAGLAVEMMVEQGGHEAIADGLALCATMQNAAPVALARLFPGRYQSMVNKWSDTGVSFEAAERTCLGDDLQAIHRLALGASGMSQREIDVIVHLRDDEDSLSKLPEELQNRVKLVKLAGQIAEAVIGVWDNWDEIAMPEPGVADVLQLWSVDTIIERTTANLKGINLTFVENSKSSADDPDPRELTYCDSASDSFDFLESVVSSIIPNVERGFNPTAAKGNVLVNCIGACNEDIFAMVETAEEADLCVAISRQDEDFYQSLPRVVSFPSSYGVVQSKLRSAVQ
ncbi:response regulator [Rubripirellula lacrimiformis]|nr:response regulator [Rubripirellula lacrimiformis]